MVVLLVRVQQLSEDLETASSPLLSGFIRAATHQLIRMSRRRVVPPNKEWIYAPKYSPRWVAGVQSFNQFTRDSLGEASNENGFDMTYQTWIHHGEQPSDHVFNVEAPPPLPANHVLNEDAPVSRLHDLFTETLGRAVGVNNFENFHNNSDCPSGDDIEDGSGGNNQDRADVNDVNYNKQLQDAAQPLYLGCSAEHTKLSTTVCLLSMKARYQCSDVFMTMLLGYLKTILPAENTLPDNCRKAKDMIKPFQFPVQIIHACINDCILYRKDYADLEECPKCKESRWKQPPEGSIPTTRKLSVKILRYFPVTERLQRMYSVPWIAELMIWYSKVVESATHMRHPVDSSQWKSIDRKWPEFCEEKRHVRLGLETDGFNPPMTDFHADAEKHLTTQNSRVTMNACTIFRESSGDTNLVDDDTTYYDVLKKILELDYGVFTEVVFYCDWARFEDKVHGSYVDRETKLRFVNFEKFARSSKEEDEPFIHASQASQVFYRSDLTRKHWNLVFESPIRSHPHMNAFEDPYVFTATSSDVPLISETIEDDDYWSGIAQGDDEYSDVDDQELALAECADDEYSDGDA